MTVDLSAPVQFVKGVGPQRAKALEELGIRTAEDLLYHLPMRYEDRRAFARIADLKPGMRVAVSGRVAVAGLRRLRRISLYEILLQDDSGRIKALWFNQPFLKDVLPKDARVILFGPVERDAYSGGRLVLASPQYEVVEQDDEAIHMGRIVPVYEKLGPLNGKALRRLLTQLVADLPADLPDPLPPEIRDRLGVTGRAEALRRVHRPPEDDDLDLLNRARSAGHRRLILEEFFLFQLGLALRKKGAQERTKAVSFAITDETRAAVRKVLPFRLTEAQKRVLREIADDMRSPRPMQRLLQGDVGAGKTVVAVLAMVVAAENGYQSAFMAPTEILAEQHFLTFKRLLARSSYRVALLSAAVKGKEKKAVLQDLADGMVHIAVGTHALLQETVRFHRLGFVVVDEQHRFGVLQREGLREKGLDADVLVMTATPIPRTLSLTAYGDLDVSLLDERPPGRTPIRTEIRPATDRRGIAQRVRDELAEGGQVYIVYPLVAESEKLEDVRAATAMAEEWRKALPGTAVGLLHGRMKPAEKEEVMGGFNAGETKVLVATTVIEVGVDVPNASLMVVEHAERFGLAQLHQLRGRVGRGRRASTCILVAHGKLSDDARARLDVMAATENGFVIAEKDLEIRGPGDFFGTRQWGLPNLRVAHLIRDRELLEEARTEAQHYADGGPQPSGPLHEFVAGGGWERRFGLARVG